jgi:signal recognition particle subunit SRP54
LERTADDIDEHVRKPIAHSWSILADPAHAIARGSMSKIMGSIPGLSGAMEGLSDEDTGAKLKRMVYIMDSMRADELDSDGLIFVRILISSLLKLILLTICDVDATG